jgi:NADH-quinone oxidoreductase subunit M
MLALTFALGLLAVLASWKGVTARVGAFHAVLLWTVAGLAGVFLALDLFLFYFFFEMMLIPMYFVIAVWGHERRVYAALKFFLFTQVSGLLMLVAIVALYFIHGRATGEYTFALPELLGTELSSTTALLLMLGFFAAFAVKLPAFPFHTWLPDAHTEAPTAGSVILAGVLIKVGAYGMLRFMVPLFPDAVADFRTPALVLAATGIIYGAVLAYAQTDLKRLVAYTSVSHMGFVLLGIFAWNTLALQGVVLQLVCHALSTGALFILVGALQDRIGTRELGRMGGLWQVVPRMGGTAMFFALASLGLPGLGNFVAEFLILAGVWQVSEWAAVLGAVGLVFATVYALWMMQRAFQGEERHGWTFADLGARETGVFAAMIAALVVIGFWPQPLITTARQTVTALEQVTVASDLGAPADDGAADTEARE